MSRAQKILVLGRFGRFQKVDLCSSNAKHTSKSILSAKCIGFNNVTLFSKKIPQNLVSVKIYN